MRVKVPRAISVIQPIVVVLPIKNQTMVVTQGVGLPGDYIDIDVANYWYETHGRAINDCVHSKVVGGTPNLRTADGGLYVHKIYSYGSYAYDGSPLDPLASHEAHAVINGLLIQEQALSIWVNPWLDFQRSGIKRHYVNVCVGVGQVDKQGRKYVYYVNRQMSYRMNWSYSEADPVTGMSSWTGQFYDASPVTIGDFTFTVDDFQRIGALHSGATGWGWWVNRYYYYPDPTSLFSDILDFLVARCRQLIRTGFDSNFKGWTKTGFGSGTGLLYDPIVDVGKRFLLHEDQLIAEGIDPMLIDKHGLPVYWRNVLVQNAYLDALDHVPRLNDNSISNIIEIAGFIKSVVVDHEIEIPRSLQDAWLAYRYSYQTTKLDAEEAISFVRRHRKLGSLSKWIECYGESQTDYVDGAYPATIYCRCCLKIRPKDVAMLAKIWRALYTYGLQPNFYVIWDMIPYSFIVDWLIPVGSLASVLDAENNYSGTYYEIKDVCFSLSYTLVDESYNRLKQYSRWSQAGVPQLNGFYAFEEDPASTKVIGMRIFDSLSLFIGKG